jgi:hypothetical protein
MTEIHNLYDRDFTTVKGRPRRHTTLTRDWVCGVCGGRLILKWFDDAPNWRTICAKHPDEHGPDEFVHSSTWAYREDRRKMEAMTAREVLRNLPEDLQAAIEADREP